MLEELFREIRYYIDSGGWVMWPLAVGTLLLWYSLGYRMFILRRGSRRSVRKLVRMYREGTTRKTKGIVDTAVSRGLEIAARYRGKIRDFLDDDFFQFNSFLGRYSRLANIIVVVAPLLGLLGTVGGMIEMFDSLGSQTFYSQTGGIARGISQALFTTQFGLAIAVPGMIVSRILDRRQAKLEKELEQIKNIICVEVTGEEK